MILILLGSLILLRPVSVKRVNAAVVAEHRDEMLDILLNRAVIEYNNAEAFLNSGMSGTATGIRIAGMLEVIEHIFSRCLEDTDEKPEWWPPNTTYAP